MWSKFYQIETGNGYPNVKIKNRYERKNIVNLKHNLCGEHIAKTDFN